MSRPLATANSSVKIRERVWNDLRLAENLGAQVVTITASSVTNALIDYAVRHNVSKIIVGKPTKPRWWELYILQSLIRLSAKVVRSIDGRQPRHTGPIRRGFKAKQASLSGRPNVIVGLGCRRRLAALRTGTTIPPSHQYGDGLSSGRVLAAIRFGQNRRS